MRKLITIIPTQQVSEDDGEEIMFSKAPEVYNYYCMVYQFKNINRIYLLLGSVDWSFSGSSNQCRTVNKPGSVCHQVRVKQHSIHLESVETEHNNSTAVQQSTTIFN